MWDDSKNQIEPELSAKERLLWSGHPQSGIVFRTSDVLLIPFSLLWGGFAITWEVIAIATGAPFFFCLFGIPFVMIGLYLIFGRFFADAHQRSKTFYGITNERVIIISGLFSRSIKSLNIEMLSDISLTEKGDKSGTITLGPNSPWHDWFGGASWPGVGKQCAPMLELIDDARTVYEIIRDAQRQAKIRI